MDFSRQAILCIYTLFKQLVNRFFNAKQTEEDNVEEQSGRNIGGGGENKQTHLPTNEAKSSTVSQGTIKYTVPLANQQVSKLSMTSHRKHTKWNMEAILKRTGLQWTNEIEDGSMNAKTGPKLLTTLLDSQSLMERYIWGKQCIRSRRVQEIKRIQTNISKRCLMTLETTSTELSELHSQFDTNSCNFDNLILDKFTTSNSEEEAISSKLKNQILKSQFHSNTYNLYNSVMDMNTSSDSEEEEISNTSRLKNKILKSKIKCSGFVSVEEDDGSSDESNTPYIEDAINVTLIKYITNSSELFRQKMFKQRTAPSTSMCSVTAGSSNGTVLNLSDDKMDFVHNSNLTNIGLNKQQHTNLEKSSIENIVSNGNCSNEQINFIVNLAEIMIPYFFRTPAIQDKKYFTSKFRELQLKSSKIGNRQKILKKKINKNSVKKKGSKLNVSANSEERRNLLAIICYPGNDGPTLKTDKANGEENTIELQDMEHYQIHSEIPFNYRLYFDEEMITGDTNKIESDDSEVEFFNENIKLYEKSFNTVD